MNAKLPAFSVIKRPAPSFRKIAGAEGSGCFDWLMVYSGTRNSCIFCEMKPKFSLKYNILGSGCIQLFGWPELQVLAVLRAARSVVEVGSLVAASVTGARASYGSMMDSTKIIVSFGALEGVLQVPARS